MTHEMALTETDSHGRELWECDECGRKMLLVWEPFQRDIIIRGDDEAIHTGGKGGLSMTATPTVTTAP